MFGILKDAFTDFNDDDSPRMAAALSYYTVFSLPPLLLLVLLLVGAVVEPAEVQGTIQEEISSLLGPEAARQVSTMVENASRPDTGGPLVLVASLAGLLFGATGAFFQLQQALNRAWEVEPDPETSGITTMLVKRLVSLGMVLTIAFLLLVSLILSAALSSIGGAVAGRLPGGLSQIALQVLNVVLSLAVVTGLFMLIFKVLPDAEVSWRDVAVGAFGTALLMRTLRPASRNAVNGGGSPPSCRGRRRPS